MKNPFRKYENFKDHKTDEYAFNYFFFKILNLFCARVKWNGLPDYIPPNFLEMTLFYRGSALFLYDKDAEMYGVFNSAYTGMPDIYNIPDIREAHGVTGYTKEYAKNNSVIIWDNPTHIPFVNTAHLYASALANAWRTRELNMFVNRTPFILKSSTNERLTWANIGDQYECYVPMIKVSDELDLKNLDVLDLKAPWLVGNISDYIATMWSNVLTDLGFTNNQTFKKERAVTDEVHGNDGEIEGMRNVALDQRKRACHAINKLFGLNVSVEFNTTIDESMLRINGLGIDGGGDSGDMDNVNS